MFRTLLGLDRVKRNMCIDRLLLIVGALVLTALAPSHAFSATHQVAPGTETIDCASFAGGVEAGDTLVLMGRSRGPVKLVNCFGKPGTPIVVRNDVTQSGPLVIEQSGSGFQTQCDNCEHVLIDGTGKWAGAEDGVCGASLVNGEWRLGTRQCGIVLKCVGGSPHSGLRLSGSSKNVTVKGLEVNVNFPTCKTGIGISVNDHKYVGKQGEWREGIRLLNNYVHSTEGEGIYVGPNQANNYDGAMQLRNNEIAHNFIDRAGCDAINYKSAIAGQSSIHHNYITNTGRTNRGAEDGCTGSGIDLWEGGFTEIYSNYVEAPSSVADGPGHCINFAVKNLSRAAVDTVPVSIYNNVLRNCKGHGVNASRGSTTAPETSVSVFSNTVVPPIGGKGINVTSAVATCTLRDNIVAGKTLAANHCSVVNNSTDAVEMQRFRDASGGDFRLTATSPAVDVGTKNCPDVDHIGTARPQENACDVGAFEFKTSEANASKPNPPQTVLVE